MICNERSLTAIRKFTQALGVAIGEAELKCFTLDSWEGHKRNKFNIRGEVVRKGQVQKFVSGFEFSLDKDELDNSNPKAGFFIQTGGKFYHWVWDAKTQTHRLNSSPNLSLPKTEPWFVGTGSGNRWIEPAELQVGTFEI